MQDKKNPGFKKFIKIKDRLIISVDLNNRKDIIELCSKINNSVSTFKLGYEVIYNCGLDIINTVKSFGYEVMLDAKLHDIPNTVGAAVTAISRLGVSKLTVHASGGAEMLKNAKIKIMEAVKNGTGIPLLFAVTVLTSLDDDDLRQIGYRDNYIKSAANLAEIAIKNGIDGIICSPNEVRQIRENLGDDFFIATPGIRLEEDNLNDQKRISTPESAIKNGADYIIAGRSITQKEEPAKIVKIILEKIEGVL